MKPVAIIIVLFALGCGNSKTQKMENKADSVLALQNVPPADSLKIASQSEPQIDTIKNPTGPVTRTDTSDAKNPDQKKTKTEEEIRYGGYRKTPACVREMISKFSSEAVTNPPRKIYQYDYKGKIVFYVPALCCDFYSDLYDMECNLIGHPDGGYTGKGDGSFKDFGKERKYEKLIWEDVRKR